ncbi:MAG: SDR family NAD(P)-dependent oxidoreductase [Candidatus Theseobacter exili]|nr:SDR family NAD(P)-dependent oxidoreductase [Candidatus Theseobacter exili]
MKVFVTGGTGFAGGVLVSKLVKSGITVMALARTTDGADKVGAHGAEPVMGDITDRDSLKNAMNGIDVVYNIAALFRSAGVQDETYWKVNFEGTRSLLEIANENKVKRFVHCSTIGVLGHIENPPADEKTSFNPGDIYQITKCEAEKLALSFGKEKGLAVSVARPAAIYGPGDMRLLKMFRMIARKRFFILGKGEVFYHPVYVDDLADGFILCAKIDKAVGEVFILGGDEYVSLNDLSRMIAKELNVPETRIHLPVKPFQMLGSVCEKICVPFGIEPPIYRRRVDFFTKSRAFDISKAKKVLGYNPKITLSEGIARTAAWYKNEGLL